MKSMEFLDRQDARTRSALKESALAMGRGLKEATSFESIVRRHPYISLGAGAAAGFLVGDLVCARGRRSLIAMAGSMATPLGPLVRAAGRIAVKLLAGTMQRAV